MDDKLHIAAPRSTHAAWLLAGATIAALLVVLNGTLVSMVHTWRDSVTYSHGFLIVPISIYLVMTKRALLRAVRPRVEPAGVVLVVFLMFGWVVARLTGLLVVEQFAMVGAIPALVWATLGSQALRILAFPLGFLFLAVPFGDPVVPLLMDWTATFTVGALQAISIPVFREGMYLSIPSGNFEVAESCSGVRYLFASLTVGVLFAYLSYRLWWKRLLFVSLALIIPVIANGIRAFGIVITAHLSDMKYAIGADHILYGAVFFGIVMLILLGIGQTFRDTAAPAVSPTTAPGVDLQQEVSPQRLRSFAFISLVSLAIVITGSLGATVLTDRLQNRAPPVARLPVGQQHWSHALSPATDWQPAYGGADDQLHEGYVSDSGRIDLHMYVYGAPTQGHELISSDNQLADGETWKEIESSVQTLEIGGAAYDVNETHLRDGSRSLLVWHWFDVDGTWITKPFTVKLNQVLALLRGDHHQSALVALATEKGTGSESARSLLANFLRSHASGIRNCIGGGAATSNACDR